MDAENFNVMDQFHPDRDGGTQTSKIQAWDKRNKASYECHSVIITRDRASPDVAESELHRT